MHTRGVGQLLEEPHRGLTTGLHLADITQLLADWLIGLGPGAVTTGAGLFSRERLLN